MGRLAAGSFLLQIKMAGEFPSPSVLVLGAIYIACPSPPPPTPLPICAFSLVSIFRSLEFLLGILSNTLGALVCNGQV